MGTATGALTADFTQPIAWRVCPQLADPRRDQTFGAVAYGRRAGDRNGEGSHRPAGLWVRIWYPMFHVIISVTVMRAADAQPAVNP